MAFDIEAHRGGRALLPENTLPAFANALTIGVSTLELDVGITRDGVLVVSHERSLNPDLARDAEGNYVELPGTPLVRLTLDEATGAITGVTHLGAGLELVSGPPAAVPVRLELTDVGWVDVTGPVRVVPLGDGLRLTWDAGRDITLSADVLVRGDDLTFRVAAHNGGRATIERISG